MKAVKLKIYIKNYGYEIWEHVMSEAFYNIKLCETNNSYLCSRTTNKKVQCFLVPLKTRYIIISFLDS